MLRQRRQETRLTQAELAQRVGVKQQTVARWEQGTSTPTRDTLTSIARVFGEPDDEWVRIASRDAASDLPRLSPPVRPRMDRLPLGELTPSEFERFTSYLLKACYPSATVSRAGGQGHAQRGADIHVRISDEIHLFQCKRVQRFGPAQMKKAAEAAEASNTKKRVIVLSRVASPAARSTAERHGWGIWDHDDIVRKLQQELSTESARRVLEVFFPGWKEDFLGIRESPWALPDEFFAGQLEKSAFFSHAYELVGREDEIAKVLEWVRGDRPFFLLTGAAGVGKSRFLMEAARRINASAGRPVVYFVDKTTTVDLEDFRRLGDARPFIVVDDAHDRDDLELIVRGVRSLFEPQRRPRTLFATRDYGKLRLDQALAEHAHELDPPTAHLRQLASADARQLASDVLGTPEDSPLSLRLAAVTRDCTLLLVAAGYLLKTKHVDPAFLDNEEYFRDAVLDKMYDDFVQGAGDLPGDVRLADLLRFLAAVHPLDLNDEEALEAASHVLGCRRDVLKSAIGRAIKIGVVVKRRSRLRVLPDLLADHILVNACFDRTLRKATGYPKCIWQASSVGLRRNLIVNVARIDWRLSATGMSPESMLDEAWGVLERDFKAGGIPQRLSLLDLLEKVAFYQPERTLSLVEWALNHELSPEYKKSGRFEYEDVRVRVAPVLRMCAYHRRWLLRSCELLWCLAKSDQRETNPFPGHPLRILCDLADYSRYKPFDYTQEVIHQAIEWLHRDNEKIVFDILERALRMESDDHIDNYRSITIYPYSVLVFGKERVLAVRNKVLTAVIQQVFRSDVTHLAVRAADCIRRALSLPVGIHRREPDSEEIAVWEGEAVILLKRIHAELEVGVRLSPPVAVALRGAVEFATRSSNEDIAEKVLNTIGDDLDYRVAEVLIHGTLHWHRRNRDYSLEDAQRWLKDFACRFLKDSVDVPAAVDRIEQLLAEATASTDAPGAGQFVGALVDQSECVGIEIVRRVIADVDSPLAQVTGTALSAIRPVDANRALELARTLVDTGIDSVRRSVAYAYGGGLASSPAVSSGDLELILELAADDDYRLAFQLSHGLRFMAERDPRMALMVILRMRVGRSRHLVIEVLGLFEWGPLRIDRLGRKELDGIVEELVVCNEIDDYTILKFLVSLSRSDLRSVVRLLQRRVEHWESLEDSDNYCPVPFIWNDECRLESRGMRDRRRILEELRDWAFRDAPTSLKRHYEAPRLFAAVAREFDDEVLDVIELGLKEQTAIAINVAKLLSEVPQGFAWSRVKWIVRILEDAERRDAAHGTSATLFTAIGAALRSAVTSGVRMGSPGEPLPEDVAQRDAARKIADGFPVGSPGERFYRSLQRLAEHDIEWSSER